MRHQPYPIQRPSTSQGFIEQVMMRPPDVQRPGSALGHQPHRSLPLFSVPRNSSSPLPMIRETEENRDHSRPGTMSGPSRSSLARSSSTTGTPTSHYGEADSQQTALSWAASPAPLSSSFSDVGTGTAKNAPDGPPPRRTLPFTVEQPRREDTTGNNHPHRKGGRGGPEESTLPERGNFRSPEDNLPALGRARIGDIDHRLTLDRPAAMKKGPEQLTPFPSRKTPRSSDPIQIGTADVGVQVTEDDFDLPSALGPVSVDHDSQSEQNIEIDIFANLATTVELLDRIPDMWSQSISECVDAVERGTRSREDMLEIALDHGCRLVEEISKVCEENFRLVM